MAWILSQICLKYNWYGHFKILYVKCNFWSLSTFYRLAQFMQLKIVDFTYFFVSKRQHANMPVLAQLNAKNKKRQINKTKSKNGESGCEKGKDITNATLKCVNNGK